MSIQDGIRTATYAISFLEKTPKFVTMQMDCVFDILDQHNVQHSASFTKRMPTDIFNKMCKEVPDWESLQPKAEGWNIVRALPKSKAIVSADSAVSEIKTERHFEQRDMVVAIAAHALALYREIRNGSYKVRFKTTGKTEESSLLSEVKRRSGVAYIPYPVGKTCTNLYHRACEEIDGYGAALTAGVPHEERVLSFATTFLSFANSQLVRYHDHTGLRYAIKTVNEKEHEVFGVAV